MFDQDDLAAAVRADVISADSATALQAWLTARPDAADELRSDPHRDEERFRFMTGFNDVFVLIAIAFVMVAIGQLTDAIDERLMPVSLLLTSWLLAEYFVRRRHMALPSIALALSTAVFGPWALLGAFGAVHSQPEAWFARIAVLVGIAVMSLHWWRFRAPISVALGAAWITVFALTCVWPSSDSDRVLLVLLLCGVTWFLVALRFDLAATPGTSRRTDVAFWLHVLSAPMIVQPFVELTSMRKTSGVAESLVLLSVCAIFGTVALAVDRRALLVSALAALVGAVSGLVGALGAFNLRGALTALVVGVVLMLLSVFWRQARALLMRVIPRPIARHLPA